MIMNRLKPIFAALLLTVLLCGCSPFSLSKEFDKDALAAKSEEVLEVINTRNYEDILKQMKSELVVGMTASDFEKAWEPALTDSGSFIEIAKTHISGQETEEDSAVYAIVALTCEYENDVRVFTMVFDTNMELVGLYMK
ncbi:MAG: DUF3887 domain-containing protein [Oscillospiraceae bacterium]